MFFFFRWRIQFDPGQWPFIVLKGGVNMARLYTAHAMLDRILEVGLYEWAENHRTWSGRGAGACRYSWSAATMHVVELCHPGINISSRHVAGSQYQREKESAVQRVESDGSQRDDPVEGSKENT